MLRAVPRTGPSANQVVQLLGILEATYPVQDVEAERYSEYCSLLAELRPNIFLEDPDDLVASNLDKGAAILVEDSLDQKADTSAGLASVPCDSAHVLDEGTISDALVRALAPATLVCLEFSVPKFTRRLTPSRQ